VIADWGVCRLRVGWFSAIRIVPSFYGEDFSGEIVQGVKIIRVWRQYGSSRVSAVQISGRKNSVVWVECKLFLSGPGLLVDISCSGVYWGVKYPENRQGICIASCGLLVIVW